MLYPSSFSPELCAQCEAGCVPPEVFADLHREQSSRPRYVRVHPASVDALCRSGDEEIRGYLLHSGHDGQQHQSAVQTAALPESWRQRLTNVQHADSLAAAFSLRERVQCGLVRQLGLALRDVHEVPWLPCLCYGLPQGSSMASNPLFRDGTLIPMDAASMAGVAALGPKVGDRVLDVCCSPGMKLNCLADAVTPLVRTKMLAPSAEVCGTSMVQHSPSSSAQSSSSEGIVVGVDISVDRQYVARSIVLKHADAYHRRGCAVPRVALFAADGCHFSSRRAVLSLDAPAQGGVMAEVSPKGITAQEQRRLQAAVRRCRKRSRDHADTDVLPVFCPTPVRLALAHDSEEKEAATFDRVLVDAECTHDGSLSHLALDAKTPSADTAMTDKDSGGLTNSYRMQRMNVSTAVATTRDCAASPPSTEMVSSPLFDLQLALLESGFAQLRVGGTLVYSTCSFSFLQNEYVVWRFLKKVNAALEKDVNAACRAVPVAPFDFTHDTRNGEQRQSIQRDGCVSCFSPTGLDETTTATLQRELDAHAADYGVRPNGVTRYCRQAASTEDDDAFITGSRLWPHERHTSFQYIAKIWKQPLTNASSA